jgi:transposase-like protein
MGEAESDVLAFMSPRSPIGFISMARNPPERPNVEIKRRAHVVGIFPNELSITWQV